MLRFVALAAVAGGCAYHPGQVLTDAEAHRDRAALRLGCLDLALAAGSDEDVPPEHPVVRLWFGNRCDHPVPFDLTRLRVEGYQLRDPFGEVHAASIDARAQGHEALEFAPLGPHDGPLCISLAEVVPDGAPAPICFQPDGFTLVPIGGAS